MIHYYILDLETNGLSVDKHEITEISIIRYSDRNQLSRNIKIKHPWLSNPESLKITGKTKQDLLIGEAIEKVAIEAEDFLFQEQKDIESICIVGHKIISFDRRFLRTEWGRLNKKFPACLWLDTVNYTKQFVKQAGIVARNGFNLANALDLAGITALPGAHSAKGDSRNNYLLFKSLMEEKKIDPLSFIKRYPHGFDS